MPDYPSWQYHHNFEEISDLAFRVGSANHPIQTLVDVLAPTSDLLVTGEADTPFFSLFFSLLETGASKIGLGYKCWDPPAAARQSPIA